MKLKIRHDDFDFRMDSKEYIEVHEKFIEAGVTEIAVLQFAQFGHLGNFRSELITYMRNTPYWDFQIHGWQHEEYDKMTFDECVRDLSACKWMTWALFQKIPTIWFPPWNRYSEEMQKAADMMGFKIDNESYDIQKFIREVKDGSYQGHSLYFHAWQKTEREAVPEMLELVKLYENRGSGIN